MKFIALFAIVAFSALGSVQADGHKILAAAKSQMGVPYSWGGGGVHGKSKGIQQGAHTVGFDCSGLAQYAVHQGTGKTIGRVAGAQYHDHHCHHVPYAKAEPGDLVFFEAGGSIHHVAIYAGHGKMVHAPHTGDHVREAAVWSKGRLHNVARCF